jgi:hypothetical protein
MTLVEPCSKAEREFFAGLWADYKRTEREVAVAFTAFCHAHGVPMPSTLEGVTEQGLLVKRSDG